MKYCSHCGNELIGNVKFCSSCGSNIEISKSQVGKPLRYKREGKSFYDNAIDLAKKALQNDLGNRVQNETINYVKNQFEKSPTATIQNEKPTANIISETQTAENKTISNEKTINKWTWIYLILNGLLIYLGHQSDEVIGVLMFSVLILVVVFFRRKSEKPYNWLVKIILVIQLIFLIALIAEVIAYISTITLLFIGLAITNLALLFKGNNS